jgi:adenosylcobinamide kinase / adenosylcobinamide-phosphate guanylyltransferase
MEWTTMKKIILVTGGARSGKSTIAEKILTETENSILYLATSVPFDDEMKDRIKKHQERRDQRWETVEIFEKFAELENNPSFLKAKAILLDCVTVMLSNWFFYHNMSDETHLASYDQLEGMILQDIDNLMSLCNKKEKKLVIVTNELGMGIVPLDKTSRMYRDIAGRINQHIAKKADCVILAVSGIPVTIKG